MEWMDEVWVLGGAAYAMVLGGAIGIERELKNRPAGFRTHMLVAGAASFLIGLGQLVMQDPKYKMPMMITVDPLRLVEAVVAGVAFIGAGTIFAHRGGNAVAGITTAASLLMVAVVGVATGFRYHVLAFAMAVLTLLVLTVLNAFERRVSYSSKAKSKGD